MPKLRMKMALNTENENDDGSERRTMRALNAETENDDGSERRD